MPGSPRGWREDEVRWKGLGQRLGLGKGRPGGIGAGESLRVTEPGQKCSDISVWSAVDVIGLRPLGGL